jgi:hypothetical protein
LPLHIPDYNTDMSRFLTHFSVTMPSSQPF